MSFEWTEWSTPPVTATIVACSWGLTFLVLALVSDLLGFDTAAHSAFLVGRALFAGASALLAVAFVAGFGLERIVRRRSRPVERPVHR
jgi:uncharacterized membrane protein YtjA (UPF0391 family)